jgi:hypothetical protein
MYLQHGHIKKSNATWHDKIDARDARDARDG